MSRKRNAPMSRMPIKYDYPGLIVRDSVLLTVPAGRSLPPGDYPVVITSSTNYTRDCYGRAFFFRLDSHRRRHRLILVEYPQDRPQGRCVNKDTYDPYHYYLGEDQYPIQVRLLDRPCEVL